MSDTLPMFPLNTVLFPGVSVPLHVFEDRYRALVHHLLRIDDPAERLFGSVAIREGYEVGEHGAQSLLPGRLPDPAHRGRGARRRHLRHRRRRPRADRAGPARHPGAFPSGTSPTGPTRADPVPEDRRAGPRDVRGLPGRRWRVRGDLLPATLPHDPTYLSWTPGRARPLPMPDRQSLLEAEDAARRGW